MNQQIKKDVPFLSIKDAATATGLSMYYLREGCKAGTVPHIRSGNAYFINIPLLLEKLNAECSGGR